MSKEFYSLPELAKRWGASHSATLALVKNGHLRAINISSNPSARARYVVSSDELEAFENRRSVVTGRKASKPKGSGSAQVIEFIK